MGEPQVLVFGTVCIDRIRRVPFLPPPGGYVEITEEHEFLGGEAANTATALAAWGVPIALAGNQIGTGPDAATLLRLVRERGLPLENLVAHTAESKGVPPTNSDDRRDSAPQGTPGRTPSCDIFLTPDGERTMFGRGFSDMRHSMNPDTIPYQPGMWFVAEPNMGDAARRAVSRAAESGMLLYLMDFMREDDPILPGSYWQSSTDWAGQRGDLAATVEWVRRWVDRYGCFAIVSDGADGFVAGSPDLPPRGYPAFPAEAVVDSTGAGDLFRAGMLYGLFHGLPTPECLRIAAAAGLLNCRHMGAADSVPTMDEIRELIAAHPDIAEQYG